MKSYKLRINHVIERLREQSIDLLIVTHSTDFRYLTGYPFWNDERLLALVIPAYSTPFVIANQLYRIQLNLVQGINKLFWSDGEDPFLLLKAQLGHQRLSNPKKMALEDSAAARILLRLQDLFPDTHYSLASRIIGPLRRIKDKTEIELLQEAAKRAENAFSATLSRGFEWVGHTEKEFAEELSYQLNKEEAPGSGLVAVGANAAQPHHVVDETVIQENELLLIDYGAQYHGYHSDETRTVFFGDPDHQFIDIYNTVLEAYKRGVSRSKVGNELEDVDKAARSYIEKQGYGDYFTHRVGHGIGLDTHEIFSVNSGVKEPIMSGNVFSVEPGIYIPGKLGVRIESLVLVQDDTPIVLHHLPVALCTIH